ncbi:MAG: hypothetical protein JRE23_17105, partial [Deltaproteobacteria bacterium]|nr:hypothetical protein [Deltaproteobacteria bacterium]
MLDPNSRHVYLEELRPPTGYILDQAVATTYSLNLLTLLAAPLAFARFDLNKKDNILDDPISVLEAIRRTAGKFSIFCETGGIKVPSSANPLFQFLEKAVIEVHAPNPAGIFHPKIWVLRFNEEKGDGIAYRFLCLSRNLTFDRSWDTVLTLEGQVRRRAFARNRPLSDFLKSLIEMANKPISEELKLSILEMAEELRHVDFIPPENIEDFKFYPLGIQGYRRFPIREEYSRLLVVSPFLSDGLVQRIAKNGSGNVLISRSEELDLLERKTLEPYGKIFVLDEAAGQEDELSIEVSSDAA